MTPVETALENHKSDEYPIISIVIVTRNDYPGLQRTIDSLCTLAEFPLEIVIVDASDLYPKDYYKEFAISFFQRVQIISEKDAGVYDGMNKGLRRASGKFVWFLNGGDSNILKSLNFLDQYKTKSHLPLIIGNYTIRLGRTSIRRNASHISKLKHGLPSSHQAIFYPREVFQSVEFKTKFTICADYASIADLFVRKIEFVYVNQFVTEFNLDGMSGKNQGVLRSEARIVQQEILNLGAVYIWTSAVRHGLMALSRKLIHNVLGVKW